MFVWDMAPGGRWDSLRQRRGVYIAIDAGVRVRVKKCKRSPWTLRICFTTAVRITIVMTIVMQLLDIGFLTIALNDPKLTLETRSMLPHICTTTDK